MKRFLSIVATLLAVFASGQLVSTPSRAYAAPTAVSGQATARPTLRYKVQGQSAAVKLAQTRLKQFGYYTGAVDGKFGVGMANAVLNYQRAQGISDTAVIGSQTWVRLLRNPQRPVVRSGVSSDIVAANRGRVVLYGDKAQRKLFYVKNGHVVRSFNVRFGGFTRVENKRKADYGTYRVHQTVSGTYRVLRKNANPNSPVYGPGIMPWSTIFDPNMYFHYSADFARTGYTRSSHGCVNIGNRVDAKWIYDNTPIGAKVVIR